MSAGDPTLPVVFSLALHCAVLITVFEIFGTQNQKAKFSREHSTVEIGAPPGEARRTHLSKPRRTQPLATQQPRLSKSRKSPVLGMPLKRLEKDSEYFPEWMGMKFPGAWELSQRRFSSLS